MHQALRTDSNSPLIKVWIDTPARSNIWYMNQAAAAKSYTQQSSCLHLPVVLATQHINGHLRPFLCQCWTQNANPHAWKVTAPAHLVVYLSSTAPTLLFETGSLTRTWRYIIKLEWLDREPLESSCHWPTDHWYSSDQSNRVLPMILWILNRCTQVNCFPK